VIVVRHNLWCTALFFSTKKEKKVQGYILNILDVLVLKNPTHYSKKFYNGNVLNDCILSCLIFIFVLVIRYVYKLFNS